MKEGSAYGENLLGDPPSEYEKAFELLRRLNEYQIGYFSLGFDEYGHLCLMGIGGKTRGYTRDPSALEAVTKMWERWNR